MGKRRGFLNPRLAPAMASPPPLLQGLGVFASQLSCAQEPLPWGPSCPSLPLRRLRRSLTVAGDQRLRWLKKPQTLKIKVCGGHKTSDIKRGGMKLPLCSSSHYSDVSLWRQSSPFYLDLWALNGFQCCVPHTTCSHGTEPFFFPILCHICSTHTSKDGALRAVVLP